MSRCRCVLGFSASATVSLFCFCLLFQGVRVGCLFQPNFGLERAKYHSPCGFFRFWMRKCAGLVHSSTALIYMRIEPVSCWLGMLAMVTYRCMLPPKTGGREKENTKYNTFRAPCSTFYLFFCFVLFYVLCFVQPWLGFLPSCVFLAPPAFKTRMYM